jgi:hypothetical protein
MHQNINKELEGQNCPISLKNRMVAVEELDENMKLCLFHFWTKNKEKETKTVYHFVSLQF